MEGTKIKDMLDKEMESSATFERKMFGLKVGDDFREMATEVFSSPVLGAALLAHVMQVGAGSMAFNRSLIAMVQPDEVSQDGPMRMVHVKNPEEFLRNLFIENLPIVELPAWLLYWGIQIGRKLEREEAQMLASLGDKE